MPRTVREWTLTDEIGRGGMGLVYRATHKFLHGDWAVKVIRPELSEDAESRQRFMSEVMVLSRLRHEHIIEIQTPFEECGQLYLPMEFLTGQSLEAALKTEPGPWAADRAVDVIRQAAAGVGYAHRQNSPILHRDIKPGNIQLLDDGRVKVLDFGLARTLGEKSMTGTGKAVGTPAYMAPEVLDGKKATTRSDVYSLGVVLYRLLAGRLPYDMPEEDSSIQAVFMAVARGLDRGLPDVREFAALTPTALADLTMSTLSRTAEGRPADGADLAGLLAKVDTRPVLPKLHHKAEYSADSTCLGIDLSSATVMKPAVVEVSGVERKSPAPDIVKSIPKQEDTDRSLIGLDLRDVGVKQPEKPVDSAPESVKTERKVDPATVVKKPVEAHTNEPHRTRRSKKGPVVLTITLLSVSALCAVSVGWWFFYEQPRRASALVASSSVEWVRIPGGSFKMGSSGSDAGSDEKPVHTVDVQTFEIAKTEVTVAQYRKCVEAGACSAPTTGDKCNWVGGREAHPVNCLDWDQSSAYAKWVGGRLPTEAEWEYAARAGTTGERYGDIDAIAWYSGNSGNRTHRVGQKQANKFGLNDMLGNVWEWVQDCSHGSYDGAPSNGSAWETPEGFFRVIRGGSWYYDASYARAANRLNRMPSTRSFNLGLRPARSVK